MNSAFKFTLSEKDIDRLPGAAWCSPGLPEPRGMIDTLCIGSVFGREYATKACAAS